MNSKTDETWVARIRYWPEDEERLVTVRIYYAWADGRIQFIPAFCGEAEPIWAEQCAQFELIRKVE